MDVEKIGKFIKTLRVEKAFTQEEFATKLNVSRFTVSKWERGLTLPDLVTLYQVSELLGVSVNEILDGKKKKGKEVNIIDTDKEFANVFNYSGILKDIFLGFSIGLAIIGAFIACNPKIFIGQINGIVCAGMMGVAFIAVLIIYSYDKTKIINNVMKKFGDTKKGIN